MRFVLAKFRNYELEALLLLGEGIVRRLQFPGFARKFLFQLAQSRIGGGGQKALPSQC